MLSLISGRQRAGKTYVCVELLIDYLRDSKRHIFSDFPLNPDLICDYAAGGKNKHPGRYRAYLERLHLFMDFTGRNRKYYRQFKAANADYVALHKSLDKIKTLKRLGRDDIYYYTRRDPLILSRSKLLAFWTCTPPNSVVFIDEAYEIFGALDQRSHGQDIRKQLLAYTRQHGHFKDDIYLISHKEGDIDKIIRNGIQKHYVISNSKYENVFQKRILMGFKWPVQFFMVKIFLMGDKKESDSFYYFPKKQIFKCYNSFSVSSSLDKSAASESDHNIDAAVDHKANIKGFTRQFLPIFAFYFCSFVGIAYAVWYLIDNFTSSNVALPSNKAASAVVGQGGAVSKNKSITIKLLTPTTIIYSDGVVIKKGALYNGYTVQKINLDNVVLSRGGVTGRYSLAALRPDASSVGVRSQISHGRQQQSDNQSISQAGSSAIKPNQLQASLPVAFPVSGQQQSTPTIATTAARYTGQGQR